jgi:protein TonB
MFDTLVESGTHTEEVKRKGSFMLGTFIVYAVILLALIVGSIMFAAARVEQQNLELMTMVAPPPPPAPEPKKPDEPKPQKVEEAKVPMTKAVVENLQQATKPPEKISTEQHLAPVIPKNFSGIVGAKQDVQGTAPVSIGTGQVGSGNTGGNPVKVSDDEPPPRPTPKPSPTPPKGPISGGVLNGKAISKPQPVYPAIAKAARQQGTVVVQILVDESGKVVSAHAVSGPPLLQQAAVQAAYQARFSPTLLSGQPVKVSGTITYNFVLQ